MSLSRTTKKKYMRTCTHCVTAIMLHFMEVYALVAIWGTLYGMLQLASR